MAVEYTNYPAVYCPTCRRTIGIYREPKGWMKANPKFLFMRHKEALRKGAPICPRSNKGLP